MPLPSQVCETLDKKPCSYVKGDEIIYADTNGWGPGAWIQVAPQCSKIHEVFIETEQKNIISEGTLRIYCWEHQVGGGYSQVGKPGLAEVRDLLVQSTSLPGCQEDVRPYTEVGNGLLLNGTGDCLRYGPGLASFWLPTVIVLMSHSASENVQFSSPLTSLLIFLVHKDVPLSSQHSMAF